MRYVLALLLLSGATLTAADFYVSPKGRDTDPGTRSKPFASFARARAAVRAERAAHPESAVTVTFAAGRFELEHALEFTPADSGASAEQPVVYRAQPHAEVVIDAGRPLSGWRPDPQRPGVWKLRVVEPQAGDDFAWRFGQLWVNGRRAVRARAPNEWDFAQPLSVDEELLPGATGGVAAKHTFGVKPELLATLKGLDATALHDVQIVVLHKWDTTREWLDAAGAGELTSSGAKMQPWNTMAPDSLLYLENYLAALDAPGEWFLARDGWLYYYARKGEDMTRARAFAPRLEQFLVVRGDIRPANWVRHIRFEGLQFRHSEFTVPAEGLPPGQAVMNVDRAAIQLDGASDIRFQNCSVEHVGLSAFWFRKACRDCTVTHSRLFDLGMAGVRIGETAIVPEAERTGGITVDNCIIQSGGRLAAHTVAVWIGQSSDNAVTHCDIGDFFYTAVSVGWRWGYGESAAKRNRVEYNHLHHLGYRILRDMGGVYTLGPSEGTRVCNNVIHDVYAARYGGWGLYPDEGSTGILFENNLVYDVRDGCVHQHYGKENVFRNNILAFSEEGQLAATRAEPHLSFTFERNLVYWDTGRLLGYSGWRNGVKVVMKNNLYWRAGGRPFDFDGQTWEQWRAGGHDEGSIIADPLFVDPARRDFRLRPGSPAEKLGFKAFDFSQAGVYGDNAWKKLAASITYPKCYTVPEPEPVNVRDDFENGTRTPLLRLATLEQEGHNDLIALTSEVAFSGKRSLRLQDRPELKAGFNPHLHWDPHYRQGRAHLSFRIRLEPGARADCEWRSQGNPYRVGPSLQFRDKAMFARGRKLLEVPENAWLGVEMRGLLGHADSRWELTLTLPDGQKREFMELPCDADWKEARWVGFSSPATLATAFELDDVEMENR